MSVTVSELFQYATVPVDYLDSSPFLFPSYIGKPMDYPSGQEIVDLLGKDAPSGIEVRFTGSEMGISSREQDRLWRKRETYFETMHFKTSYSPI